MGLYSPGIADSSDAAVFFARRLLVMEMAEPTQLRPARYSKERLVQLANRFASTFEVLASYVLGSPT
jgi:hypothetical protein